MLTIVITLTTIYNRPKLTPNKIQHPTPTLTKPNKPPNKTPTPPKNHPHQSPSPPQPPTTNFPP